VRDISLSLDVTAEPGFPSEDRVGELVMRVLTGEERLHSDINIVLAGHERVLELNRSWLEHDYHTDVLSFLLESDPIEGEVYVDVETAAERHHEFDSSLTAEIERYIVHGVLHLCGYDDSTDAERDVMRRLEDRYLNGEG